MYQYPQKGLPRWLRSKGYPPTNAADMGLILGLEEPLGGENGDSLNILT